jgi:hypothetical protein
MIKNLRNYLVLAATLISTGLLAQISPSAQSVLTSPALLSACSRDTVILNFTNRQGPGCTANGGGPVPTATFTVGIPSGNTSIKYQAGSITSIPTGATAVVSGGNLIITAPVPSFGATTGIKFVVNTACEAAPSDTLPYFKVAATYPPGFTTTTESWVGTKMNTGIAQLVVTPYCYVTCTNPIVGFDKQYGWGNTVQNSGFGAITELQYHIVLDDSIYFWYTGDLNNYHALLYKYTNNGALEDAQWCEPTAYNGGGPDASFSVTKTLLGGKRYFTFTFRGTALGAGKSLDPGDYLNIYDFFKGPSTCIPDQNMKEWFTYTCAAGGNACAKPDTIFNTIKVSAGTPIISSLNAKIDSFDGCPGKSALFTFKNTGIPDPTKPEVSMAYDVDLSVALGGLMNVSNLTFGGTTGTPTTQTIPGNVTGINWKIKNANTNPSLGFVDADGDGFYDDLKAGDSINVSWTWEVPCNLACGKDMNFDMKANSSFTDYCRKLNGSGSVPIYKFGFEQTAPISQTTPVPDFGTMGLAQTQTRTGSFTWQYKQTNLNLANAVVKLRINYSSTMSIVEPISFLGVTRSLADFTVIGTGYTPPAGTTADVLNTAVNTTDNDSALEYTLTYTELLKLFDNNKDSLAYSMTHVSCDSFQNQGNGNNWQLIFQMSNTPCAVGGNPPCGMDLACKKGFGYQINEGCGTVPCYIVKDTLYRSAIIGYTGVDKTTTAAPISPIGTSKFYPGDTMTNIFSSRISADDPIQKPIGSFPFTYDLYNFFALTFKQPAGSANPDGTPLEFIPNISKIYVVDTTTGDTIAMAPLLFSDFQRGFGSTLSTKNPSGPWTVGDKLLTGYTPGGPGLNQYYCTYQSWTIGGPANADCPYDAERYYNPSSNVYARFRSASGVTYQDDYYLHFETALARAGYSFEPGYRKYIFLTDTKWRVSTTFNHANVGDFNFYGGTQRYADGINKLSGQNRSNCGAFSASGTIITNDLSVKDGGKQYSSLCGLTVNNKLFFKSTASDFFPAPEVRVPYTIDSVVMDLPAEYTITSGTPLFNYVQGGTPATTTAIANSAPTGHVKWTSTVGTDFPRFDDASGNNVVFDLQYTLSNTGTDNGLTDNYNVPVTFYGHNENGSAFTRKDLYFINEGTGAITISSLTGGVVNVANAGMCGKPYMDVLIANNTLYAAAAAMLNVEGSANTSIESIVDLGTPVDSIGPGDVAVVTPIRKYAILGGIAPAEQRVIRVYFNTTVCEDSIKFVTNFGCNYPVGYDVYGYPSGGASTTLDSTYIKFKAIEPKLMVGAVTPKINVKSLCDTLEVVVQLKNVKSPNLFNIFAGFKIPTNMVLVPNSLGVNITTASLNPGFYVTAPSTSITYAGVSGDSVVLNTDFAFTNNTNLTGWGSSPYYYPGCGLNGPSNRGNLLQQLIMH